jgi:hypothetical protein
MPDENPNERDWEALERETVYLLTNPTRHPPIWLVADIGRELEEATRTRSCAHLSTQDCCTAPAMTTCSLRLLRSRWFRWSVTSSEDCEGRRVAGLGVALPVQLTGGLAGCSPAVKQVGAPAWRRGTAGHITTCLTAPPQPAKASNQLGRHPTGSEEP